MDELEEWRRAEAKWIAERSAEGEARERAEVTRGKVQLISRGELELALQDLKLEMLTTIKRRLRRWRVEDRVRRRRAPPARTPEQLAERHVFRQRSLPPEMFEEKE